jgi:hypothetical protein
LSLALLCAGLLVADTSLFAARPNLAGPWSINGERFYLQWDRSMDTGGSAHYCQSDVKNGWVRVTCASTGDTGLRVEVFYRGLLEKNLSRGLTCLELDRSNGVSHGICTVPNGRGSQFTAFRIP